MSVDTDTDHSGLPVGLAPLLAAIAGFGVAAIYFPQPMLGVMSSDLQTNGTTIGWVPTLMQAGYSLGICFLAPLGDRLDRRKIILTKTAVVFAALLACA